MIPALAQVCSLPSPFPDDVSDYASGQCRAVEIWFTKLENFLRDHSPAEARARLADVGVTIAAASYQGGLLDSQGAARSEAWELFRRRLDLCAETGIPTIVVACDVAGPLNQESIDRVSVSLTQVVQECQRREVRAALEFQARSALGNNLQTAAALIERAASPWVGVCLDAYHFYTGPSKLEDLAYLTRENLAHVQFCDLADTLRELAIDGDRILPGDGDIPLAAIAARLREIGYERYVSLELFNPRLWQVPARQFGEIGLTALRKSLGMASMGND